MQKEDFKVGQTVYLLEQRFAEFEYRGIQGFIKEAKVLTVGRKYITVHHHVPIKFDITEEFREVTDFSPTFRLYLSKEDILNEFKRKEIIKEVHESTRYSGGLLKRMTDDDLQTILNIIRKYSR